MKSHAASEGHDRRSFISRLIGFIGTAALSDAFAFATPRAVNVFAEESGALHDPDYLCLGALVVPDPAPELLKIHAIRKQCKYNSRLQRHDTASGQLTYAEAMIDHFFQASGLRFQSRVAAGAEAKKADRQQLYKYHYRQLLSKVCSHQSQVQLIVNNHSKSGQDRYLHQYLKTEIPQIKDVHIVKIADNDLLQLSGFLTGYVWADCPHPDLTLSNKTKAQIMQRLHERCQTKALSKESFSYKQKFTVTVA